MPTAILLIAHGSRQAEANADLHHLVAELRRRGTYAIVEPAFLELAEPTIAEAGRRCVEAGADRVILLPYFLSSGIHVQQHLQEHAQRLSEQFPQVGFQVGEPLGPHPLLLEIVAQRAREVEKTWKNG